MFNGIYTIYHLITSASLWLSIGSSTIVICVLAVTGLTNSTSYPDPFARYADIRPGQPVSVLEPFHCLTVYFPGTYDRDTCHFSPNDGVFTSVLVKKANEQIQTVTFYSGNLRVGDLIGRWGKPKRVIRDTHFYIALWDQGVTTYTVSSERRFSFLLPIQFVTLSGVPSAGE